MKSMKFREVWYLDNIKPSNMLIVTIIVAIISSYLTLQSHLRFLETQTLQGWAINSHLTDENPEVCTGPLTCFQLPDA